MGRQRGQPGIVGDSTRGCKHQQTTALPPHVTSQSPTNVEARQSDPENPAVNPARRARREGAGGAKRRVQRARHAGAQAGASRCGSLAAGPPLTPLDIKPSNSGGSLAGHEIGVVLAVQHLLLRGNSAERFSRVVAPPSLHPPAGLCWLAGGHHATATAHAASTHPSLPAPTFIRRSCIQCSLSQSGAAARRNAAPPAQQRARRHQRGCGPPSSSSAARAGAAAAAASAHASGRWMATGQGPREREWKLLSLSLSLPPPPLLLPPSLLAKLPPPNTPMPAGGSDGWGRAGGLGKIAGHNATLQKGGVGRQMLPGCAAWEHSRRLRSPPARPSRPAHRRPAAPRWSPVSPGRAARHCRWAAAEAAARHCRRESLPPPAPALRLGRQLRRHALPARWLRGAGPPRMVRRAWRLACRCPHRRLRCRQALHPPPRLQQHCPPPTPS